MSALVEQPLLPHLIVRSLETYDTEPCILLDGAALTYRDVRRQASQLVQAQRQLGVGAGASLAVLSKNRPEVLTNMVASLVNGCVVTPLHPMGQLPDHDYVIGDAGIECLVYDPVHFSERASALKNRHPALILMALGPDDVGVDYLALADTFEPKPW